MRRFTVQKILLLAGLCCGLLSLMAPPVLAMEMAATVGTFLVARDGLPDPRFNKSVILLIQHDDGGSAGLIVNRPSRLPLADLLGDQPDYAGLDGLLSYGGPVASNSLLALARVDEQAPTPSSKVFDSLYVTGIVELADWLARDGATMRYRVFSGYAGWAPGQLAVELARGDWRVLPADINSIFSARVDDLWLRLNRTRLL
ncbi:MAG: YqgE/AlgH family protein [Desulfuromonadales bacterium]|nr:YqgE/AlgH family protein [Desulfuromonadales bacterium]